MAAARRALSTRARLLITLTAVLVVIAFVALNIRLVPDSEVAAANAPVDLPATAQELYDDDIEPFIRTNAVDLPTLLTDLGAGADPATYGNSAGTASAFAYPITVTAVVGETRAPVTALTIAGIPEGVSVVLQTGPAINGSALRDVSGALGFGDFADQNQYLEIGTLLNDIVRSSVLSSFDPAATVGKTITITGTYLAANPAVISIVPTDIVEVTP